MLAFYNVEDRKRFDDLGDKVEFLSFQLIAFYVGGIITTCLYEKAYVFIPLTFVYQIGISYGLMSNYYGATGKEHHYKLVYDQKLTVLIKSSIMNSICQYIIVVLAYYLRSKLHMSISQAAIAKESLKVIVNRLNEAIIIKTSNGTIGYSNDIGINIIKSISHGIFNNDA